MVAKSIPEGSVALGNPIEVIGTIQDWYDGLIKINKSYPWYAKNISHDEIVKERAEFFMEK